MISEIPDVYAILRVQPMRYANIDQCSISIE